MSIKLYGRQVLRIAVGITILVLMYITNTSDVTALAVESQIYFEDFESGYNGWSVNNGVWEIGNSTINPAGCYKGSTGCAGTVLDGNYPPYTDSALKSPSIILPSVKTGEEIHLNLWHWFSYGWEVYGYIAISVYNTTTEKFEDPNKEGGNIGSDSAVWSFTDRDLTQYAGKRIQIYFQHYNIYANVASGWTIDNVEIIKSYQHIAPQSASITSTPTSIAISTPTKLGSDSILVTSLPIKSINYSILNINKTSTSAPEIKETIIKNSSNGLLFLNGTALSISGKGIKMITVNGNYVDTKNFYVNVTNEKTISIMAMDNDGNITTKNISLTTNINSDSIPWTTYISLLLAVFAIVAGLFKEKILNKITEIKKYMKWG